MKAIPVIFILGPTAVGKTQLSIALAKKIDAEIISADSRQVYKYMDIGTAKPSLDEQNGIPHHLLDKAFPDQLYNAGKFASDANEIIKYLRLRNKNAIVSGGTGLYIKALVDGLIPVDFSNESIRNDLEKRFLDEGLNKLYKSLEQLDPLLAKQLNPNDKQRILRGLEVVLSTGRPLSEWHKMPTTKTEFAYKMFGLSLDRDQLYHRINQRVDRMLQVGLIDEVDRLLQMGYSKSHALNAVGYKELIAFRAGEISYNEMVELIKRNSRRYAKRQLTWFRKDQRIQWIDCNKKATDEVVQIILSSS